MAVHVKIWNCIIFSWFENLFCRFDSIVSFSTFLFLLPSYNRPTMPNTYCLIFALLIDASVPQTRGTYINYTVKCTISQFHINHSGVILIMCDYYREFASDVVTSCTYQLAPNLKVKQSARTTYASREKKIHTKTFALSLSGSPSAQTIVTCCMRFAVSTARCN